MEDRWLDRAWFLFFAVLSSLWLATAGHALGPTFDEPIYLEKGLERWRTGSYHGLLRLGTMPLPVDVQTLPLYLWERWQGTTFDPAVDMDVILPLARLGNLLFWWLLLFSARLIGRALAGPWAGRLAVAFLAVEPSFLGHACLATTDLSVTACFLAFVYAYWRGRDGGWWARIAWPAFWFGLLTLAKASGMVFAPLAMLGIEVHRLADQGTLRALSKGTVGERWRALRAALAPLTRDGLRIAGWGFVVVFVYCGSDWQPQASFVAWAHGLADGSSREVMVWLAEHLRIFPNAAVGLLRQVKHNVQGHSCFLLGEEHYRALWYYFPVLLVIKLSLPLLMLPLALAATRLRSLYNWALLAFAVLLIFSFSFRVQIGIRMVLPLVALGVVGLAGGLAQAMAAWGPGLRRRIAAWALGACWLWTAADAARVWPHGLAFTNECFGSTRSGYVYVSDANYDWGQGLKDLEDWQCWSYQGPVAVWYFGTDPALREWDALPLHQLKLRTLEEFHEKVRGKLLAVSTTHFYGSYTPGAEVPRAILRGMTPRHRTRTFLIYDFRDVGAAAASR